MAADVDIALPSCLRCPDCRGTLRDSWSRQLVCSACRAVYAIEDGVIVLGQADRVAPRSLGVSAADVIAAAGDHWPEAFGVTLVIGSDVSGLTGALAAEDSVAALTVMDDSADRLRDGRGGADGAAPTLVAVNEIGACLRDVSVDTIIGSVRCDSPRAARLFLNEVYRVLNPGGRALFVEPNPLFRARVLNALAGAIALLPAALQDSALRILEWLAHQRRAAMARQDAYLLVGFDAHRSFMRQAFVDQARTLGFTHVALLALPREQAIGALVDQACAEVGIGTAMRPALVAVITAAMPVDGDDLLPAPNLLITLEKPKGPHVRLFALPDWPPAETPALAARWVLALHPVATEDGLAVTLDGWCLLNRDAVALAVTAGGVTARAAIWRPRSDVHQALNGDGQFPAWNAMCCGVSEQLVFPGVRDDGAGVALAVRILLVDGVTAAIPCPETITAGNSFQLTR